MQENDTEQLQITYYNNMEFFRDFNQKLFEALAKSPTLYNLHIDSYGYNIIHLPTQTKHYPLIERQHTKHMQANTITPETHTTSMQAAHKELAQNPIKNAKWELFTNHPLQVHAHFINEEKLPITGKHCNALLQESIRIGLESCDDTNKCNPTIQDEITQHNITDDSNFYNAFMQDSIHNQYKATTQTTMQTPKHTLGDSHILNPHDTMQKLDFNNYRQHKIDNKEKVIQANKSPLDSINAQNNTMQHDIATQSNMLLSHNLLESFYDSKFLPQTNIYGLMGGLFLQQLIQEGYYFHSLLIYEEHIDLFRISLYFLDYAKLFQHVSVQSCFIIIKDISLELVRAFLHAKKITNNFLSLHLTHYTTKNVTYLKDFIYKEKKALMRGWGSLEDELVGFHNACINLKDCKLLSTQPQRIHAPICVIGNGASLDLCIDFLKTYQDSMILLSCGTALKVLRYHGIVPDFQVEIERVPYLWQVLTQANLGDIPLLFAQTTDTKACQLSKERYGFLRGGSSSAYLDSTYPALEFSAPFVGNAGVSIAALLGSDVILCGMDCGYIAGYSKHAKHSFYGDEDTMIPPDCFQVQGNKHLQVFSNDLFYLSAKNIEEALKLYQPNSTINLGYGTYFHNTLNLNEDDFTLKPIDKAKEIAHFKANFTAYNLAINTNDMLTILDTFSVAIQGLIANNIHTLQDVFTLTQNILALLQKNIDNITMRKSIILLEGSIMHLSHTHLLAQLFAGVPKKNAQYDRNKEAKNRMALKQLYLQGVIVLIQECKNAIQKQV